MSQTIPLTKTAVRIIVARLQTTIKKQNFVNVHQMNRFHYTITISASAIDNFTTNMHKDKYDVSSVITTLSDHDGQTLILNMF